MSDFMIKKGLLLDDQAPAKFVDASGVLYVSIKAPSQVNSGNVFITLPAGQPASGTILVANASGELCWCPILKSGDVTSGFIGNNAVVSGSIASGQISVNHLASGVLTAGLTSGIITSGLIGNAAVVSGSIASGSISGPHLASGVINAISGDVKITSGSISVNTIFATSGNTGVGTDITIKAADAVSSGAGGNIILQPGLQSVTGGDGKTIVRQASGLVGTNEIQIYYDSTYKSVIESKNGPTHLLVPQNQTVRIGRSDTISLNRYIAFNAGDDPPAVISLGSAMTGIRVDGDLFVNQKSIGFSAGTNTIGAKLLHGADSFNFAVIRVSNTTSGGGSFAHKATTTTINSDTNNLSLDGSAFQRLNVTSGATLTGLSFPSGGAHVDGRFIRLVNVGTQNLTLSNQDTNSSGNNRFYTYTSGNIVLGPNRFVDAVYDSTTGGWRVYGDNYPYVLPITNGTSGQLLTTNGNNNLVWANGFGLTSGGITSGMIANNAVVSGSIASGQVGINHLASGTVNSFFTSGFITSGMIGNNAVVSGSIASGSIGSVHLADGAILSGDISSGQIGLYHLASGTVLSGTFLLSGNVTSGYLGNNSVNSGNITQNTIRDIHIASGGLLSGSIGSGIIGSVHLADGAVQSGDVSSGQIGLNHLASGTTTGNSLSGQILFNSANAVNGTSSVTWDGTFLSATYLKASNSIGDEGGEILLSKPQTNTTLSGTGVTIDLYQDKIRFFEQGGDARGFFLQITSGGAGVGTNIMGGGPVTLQSGQVTSGFLGNAAVVSGSIASGQIGANHIASGVLAAGLTSGSVTSGYIGNSAVVSGSIASGIIGLVHLASGTVFSGTFLLSGNVTSGYIGNNSVNSGNITAGTIRDIHIASGGLLSGSIGSGIIGSVHLADGAVLSGDISSGQIGVNHLISGLITTLTLGSGQVTSGNISSGSISQFKLSSGTVNSGQIGNNAVVSGSIAGGEIGAEHLASGFIFAQNKYVTNLVLDLEPGENGILSGSLANIFIGDAAGARNIADDLTEVINNSIFIGYYTRSKNTSGDQYCIAIGGNSEGSNTTVIGYDAHTFSGTIYGNINFPHGLSWHSGYIASGGPLVSTFGSGVILSGNIASGQIGANHIASGVISAGLTSGSVTSGYIGNAAVVSGSIASGSISQFKLSSGAVNSGQIGNNAVVSGSIASGTLGTFHFSSGAVLSGNISSGQIGQFHLSNSSVTSGIIASGSVSQFKLSSGTVNSGQIGNNAVVSGSIASGSIGQFHFASGQLNRFAVTNATPSNPVNGDRWFNTDTGILLTYVDDGSTQQWVQL